jgi:two-component system response regulator YesN
MRIVVVEDEQNTLDGLIKLITKLDGCYQVIGKADNGQDGYSIICELRPDLVFTDIKMPFMSGIDMLDNLYKQGHRHKTVVLTGYSEYVYVKKALQLGVRDYLEKPITSDDLKAVLEKIEYELVYEQLGGLPNCSIDKQTEHLIQQTLLRDDIDPALLSYYLKQLIGFPLDHPLHLFQFYSSTDFQEMERLLKEANLKINLSISAIFFSLPSDHSVYLFLQTEQAEGLFDEMEIHIRNLLPHLPSIVVSRTEIASLSEIRKGINCLIQLRRWSLSNVPSPILSELTVSSTDVAHFQYQEHFDNRITIATAESNREEIHRIFTDWLAYVSEKCYPPQQIIDATVHLVSVLLNQLSSHRVLDMTITGQNKWLNSIWNAQTKYELTEAVKRIADQSTSLQNKVSYSLTVMKALQIIHVRYQDGINLDEIANILRITPEYLSSLFTREIRQTYSSYIKNYRIKKAQELLIQSELKTFEIAQKVGYPDAKYFSRVFREVTGLTPGEYQRLHTKS